MQSVAAPVAVVASSSESIGNTGVQLSRVEPSGLVVRSRISWSNRVAVRPKQPVTQAAFALSLSEVSEVSEAYAEAPQERSTAQMVAPTIFGVFMDCLPAWVRLVPDVLNVCRCDMGRLGDGCIVRSVSVLEA